MSTKEGGKSFWGMGIMGLLFFIIGFVIWFHPAASYVALTIYFVITFLILAMFYFVDAISSSGDDKAFRITLSVINLILALVLFFNFGITAAMIPFLVGFMVLFYALDVIRMSSWIREQDSTTANWTVVIGILLVILAFIMLFHPGFAALNLIIWTGASFVLYGMLMMILSFKLK